MNQNKNTSPVSPDNTKVKKRKVNWHKAASFAMQIELIDFTDILEFQTEYVLGRNYYRIDMLIIKKLISEPIPKNIASIFKSYNLFEFKGIGSSISPNSFYKTIGYTGILINQIGQTRYFTALDMTITFLSFHYPRKLMRHLIKECKLTVEKPSPGIYHFIIGMFSIQIIVTKELSAEENLYLKCMTNKLKDRDLIDRLAEDYQKHKNQEIYAKYLDQITIANNTKEGASIMVCEGLLNLYGTSSEEIIARTKKEQEEFYLPKINELHSTNKQLYSQNNYLKDLLRQNNIPFDLEAAADQSN